MKLCYTAIGVLLAILACADALSQASHSHSRPSKLSRVDIDVPYRARELTHSSSHLNLREEPQAQLPLRMRGGYKKAVHRDDGCLSPSDPACWDSYSWSCGSPCHRDGLGHAAKHKLSRTVEI
eukprot:279063-Rhodomonas_salina.2